MPVDYLWPAACAVAVLAWFIQYRTARMWEQTARSWERTAKKWERVADGEATRANRWHS